MKINRHFTKNRTWKLKNTDYSVRLLKITNTINGIVFCAEVASGPHKGKWTTLRKSDISYRKGL